MLTVEVTVMRIIHNEQNYACRFKTKCGSKNSRPAILYVEKLEVRRMSHKINSNRRYESFILIWYFQFLYLFKRLIFKKSLAIFIKNVNKISANK